MKKSNEELASFNFIASHDLQEPLRKIQLFANRILKEEDETLSGTGKQYFLRLQNAAANMQQLIADLLAYSYTSTVQKNFILTDLNAVLEDAKEDLRHLIEPTKAEIVAQPLPKMKVIPLQFKQLFINLFSNSIKFTKPNSVPHIEITTDILDGKEISDKRAEPKKKYHRITFSDNGIGFNPEYRSQVFELFQRLHGKKEYPGTGLGLAICKRVVENHNGFIAAESQEGKGASFHLYLPVNGRV